MAAPILRVLCRSGRLLKQQEICRKGLSRTLLSKAYSCDDVWADRLKSPILHQVGFSEYAVQLFEKYEREGEASVIDIDVFANKLHEMNIQEEGLVEHVLSKFRRSKGAVPIKDNINHAVIRNYIETGNTISLLSMMKDRHKFGIFPDFFAASILMNHLLLQKDYSGASQVAYELMLQEDFSHEVSRLLSLYACVKHWNSSLPSEYLQVETPGEDEEEEWVPVKVIRNLFYDNHFDIKDERYLMGKTLYVLGRTVEDGVMARSLQLTGLALFHKFPLALDLLDSWTTAADGPVVTEEAMQQMTDCLDAAPTRDPDVPEKDMGLRTMDDEVDMLKLTPAEKEECQAQYQALMTRLQDGGMISTDSVEDYVDSYVKAEIPKFEGGDIEVIQSWYNQWSTERQEQVDEQVKQYIRQAKEEEIQKRLAELQKKEELLTFFEHEETIRKSQPRGKKKKKQEEIKEDEYVEAPGERMKGKKK